MTTYVHPPMPELRCKTAINVLLRALMICAKKVTTGKVGRSDVEAILGQLTPQIRNVGCPTTALSRGPRHTREFDGTEVVSERAFVASPVHQVKR